MRLYQKETVNVEGDNPQNGRNIRKLFIWPSIGTVDYIRNSKLKLTTHV